MIGAPVLLTAARALHARRGARLPARASTASAIARQGREPLEIIVIKSAPAARPGRVGPKPTQGSGYRAARQPFCQPAGPRRRREPLLGPLLGSDRSGDLARSVPARIGAWCGRARATTSPITWCCKRRGRWVEIYRYIETVARMSHCWAFYADNSASGYVAGKTACYR